MRATYHKLQNIITVEFEESEVAQYLKLGNSKEDLNFRPIVHRRDRDELITLRNVLTIPCSKDFYLKSQRQKGGVQPWDKEELRAAVRAAVANRLVKPAPYSDREAYGEYRKEWQAVANGLRKNVRLLFPSSKYPRQQLSRTEQRFRREWRRKHRLR